MKPMAKRAKDSSKDRRASAARTKARDAREGAVSSPPGARAASPDPREPSSYPRRILLAVTGLSPQVVTETLYALAVQDRSRFIPTEIHLITTAEGAERARLSLFSEDPGWFHRLRRDYDLPGIAFDAGSIRVLTGTDGRPLDDIRSEAHNERAADLITKTVRELTADPAAALHVSIAGGRKTMGFYLGYALSLYGRAQDKLSHVLVSEPFESSWDFFYPTRYSRVLSTRDNKLVDTRDAKVTLADIPFVRLREELPRRLLAGQASFTETVNAANRGISDPKLTLRPGSAEVYADGERIDLGPTELAVLVWLAQRVADEHPDVDWATADAAEEFAEAAARVIKRNSGDYERLEEALKWRSNDGKALGDYFEPQKSRVNRALVEALGEHAAQRYQIRRTGPRGCSRYYLPLSVEQIEILD